MNKGIYSYAIFALPLSFIGIPIYIYLPEFYSSNFGISLSSIGFVVLLTRIFDTITDPLCGHISDMFAVYRKLIICFSALLLGISFYFLFNPIIQNKAFNLIVFSVTTYLFFSLLTVNHLSLISNFDDKVRTSSLREVFTVVGLLLATIVPSVLMLQYSSLQVFRIIGFSMCFLLLLCVWLFYKNIQIKPSKTYAKPNWSGIRTSIIWKYFTILLFNGMAIAAPSTLVIFYIKNFLELGNYIGIFLGSYFLSAIVFIPIWKILCKKVGALQLFKIGMIGSIATFSLCYFVGKSDFYFYLSICLFSGIFFGIDLIAPTIITNDIIEKQNIGDSITFIFSITHFISKISIAIVSGILLVILGSKFGDDYNNIIHFSYTILPCILKIISLYFLIKL
jgi:GPH family glycoside/pentoside/hexuronide:cation symporter